ncbi:gamma-butyrobetaine hydroxylase-like domain-containing protein [Henriciella sp.]|uniref:gamma-butyrobetaine hydroxylase-like domain-containing protein n=1 Tax=Henriciella sp. TaxID=1968823 RepID=UPI00262DA2EE|nr:gamma-butyrobetaine hydroxylase-like domain-containing protein [Henriciella sp.]
MTVMPWPTELRFRRAAGVLRVSFEDETSFDIPYKRLREESPSAEVRGHGAGPRPPQPPVPDDISVEKADPVGRYAVRIYFSDGHSSGLYTWKLLRELGEGAAG